jgi:uncharacterized membrane protein YbhN (UPF0104 family)
MTQHKYSSKISGRTWLRLLIIGFLMYIIAAGFGGLQHSLGAIENADPLYIVLAVAAIALSYICAAITYTLLSPKRLPFGPTLLVQIAGGLVNRILPAGLGGMGLNLFYLKKRGHSVPVAAAMAATNNLLGFVGNVLLVTVSLLVVPIQISLVTLPDVPGQIFVIVAALMAAAFVFVSRRKNVTVRMRDTMREISRYLRGCLRQPARSFAALVSSCLLTALHGLGLFLVLYAVGDPQSWTVALLAISIGAFVGASVPTPGGLGGAEAGIAAVLLAFSVPLSISIASALIYRGITYWLPLLPGYFALRVVEKRYL